MIRIKQLKLATNKQIRQIQMSILLQTKIKLNYIVLMLMMFFLKVSIWTVTLLNSVDEMWLQS